MCCPHFFSTRHLLDQVEILMYINTPTVHMSVYYIDINETELRMRTRDPIEPRGTENQ